MHIQRHIPVALERCIQLLSPSIEAAVSMRGRAVVVDATKLDTDSVKAAAPAEAAK